MLQKRQWASMCNFKDELIFVSGGLGLRSVERYDLKNDHWKKMPLMNEIRENHASCALGSAIYMFCGFNDGNFSYTIERLEVVQPDQFWHLILFPEASKLIRSNPSVCAVEEKDEIVIFCGENVFTFDTKSLCCRSQYKRKNVAFYPSGHPMHIINDKVITKGQLEKPGLGSGHKKIVVMALDNDTKHQIKVIKDKL